MTTADTWIELARQTLAPKPAWHSDTRRTALDAFSASGLPTTRLETWKYTSLKSLSKQRPVVAESQPLSDAASKKLSGLVSQWRLVFVNGHAAPELSSTAGLPDGVSLETLSSASEHPSPELEKALAKQADYTAAEHALVALSTATATEGAVLQLAPGVVLAQPVELVFITIANAADKQIQLAQPRVLVLAGSSSQLQLIERHSGFGEAAYVTNSVTEIVLEANARVEHYKLQEETSRATHLAAIEARLARAASFESHSVSLGGALVRNDFNAALDGEGSHCSLNGLFMTNDEQHVDNHTTIEHLKPHCTSRELYKGVLAGSSTAVFNGRVYVAPDAQKTDAQQTNKNLLLSDNALINTKPELEIHADDVKCAHGSTVGQLDAEALFYLRSRGIPKSEAESLLVYAFSNELVGRIAVPWLKSELESEILKRLGGSEHLEMSL